MSNTDDVLFRGLQMLQQGVQQAATSYAINDAQKFVDQINTNITDEAQKRQALSQLGNQLALKLASTGASGTQIQAAFNAIAPQQYNSVEQLALAGELQGNEFLQKTAAGMQSKARKSRQEDLAMEFAFKQRLAQQQADLDLRKELIKANKTTTTTPVPGFEFASGVKPTEDDVKTLKNVSMAYDGMMRGIQRLDGLVNEVGTEAVSLGGNDKARMVLIRKSLITQMKELEKLGALAGPDMSLLEDMLPDPTAWRTSKYLAQSEEFKTTLNERVAANAKARGAIFTGYVGSNPDQQQTKSSTSNDVLVKKLPNGQRIKVRKLADGSYEEVP